MSSTDPSKNGSVNNRWIVTLEENENGELILPFTYDMLTTLGWQEGDTLQWHDNKNGTWSITRKESNESLSK